MISDLKFFGGSFGAAFGEKFKRAVDFAVKHKFPVVSICASGGARMNEGPMSLAQMAKMNMAILDLKRAGVLFLSVITGPTTGGAYASYATQGDIMFGEKGSLVEFAGPRVVTGAGFTVDREIVCTDSLYETGKIQHLVDRKDLKESLAYYINIYHDMTFPNERRITGRVNDFRKEAEPVVVKA
jgi:acetyl-CoA carboxylase beta subunit